MTSVSPSHQPIEFPTQCGRSSSSGGCFRPSMKIWRGAPASPFSWMMKMWVMPFEVYDCTMRHGYGCTAGGGAIGRHAVYGSSCAFLESISFLAHGCREGPQH